MGGLGNQIFQYALAQWLCQEWNVSPVLFDPGSDAVPGRLNRAVQLSGLFPDCRILSGPAAKAIHVLSLSRKYQGALSAIGFRHYPFLAPEPSWQRLIPTLVEATQRRYSVISGYFQFGELVRTQLDRLRCGAATELEKRGARLSTRGGLQNMDFERDCLVHVRRGDYTKIEGYPLLDHNYYSRAREVIGRQGFRGRMYCVSDDPVEAGRMLSSAGFSTVSLDICDPLDVLGAIANARYKIIANSTLSLWGALLGREDGRVVFPARWLPGNQEVPALCRSVGWLECQAG